MATINISIEGLGILFFDRKGAGAEIAFLRHERHGDDAHELRVHVQGGECNLNERNIPTNADIKLIPVNPTIERNVLNYNENFHRLSGLNYPNNEDDLDWLVDLENTSFHGKNQLRRKRHSGGHGMPISKLFLPPARFYTARHSTVNNVAVEYFLLNRRNGTSERFGIIGSALGAEFSASNVQLIIGTEEVCVMNENTNYTIKILNTRRVNTGRFVSDFSMYYHVLSPRDGKEFDFHLTNGGNFSTKSSEADDLDTLFRSPDPAMCNIPQLGDKGKLEDLPPED